MKQIENVKFYKMACTKKDGFFMTTSCEENYTTNSSVLLYMNINLDSIFILLNYLHKLFY